MAPYKLPVQQLRYDCILPFRQILQDFVHEIRSSNRPVYLGQRCQLKRFFFFWKYPPSQLRHDSILLSDTSFKAQQNQ